MKHLFTLPLIGLITLMTNLELNAQKNNASNPPSYFGNIRSSREVEKYRGQTEELKGNPFLFEDWNTKGIVYSDGDLFEVDQLNYNIFKEEVGELKDNETYFSYDSQFIDSVKIDKKCLRKLEGVFYESLYTGSKISLYKKYNARIAQGQFNPIDGTVQQSRIVIMDDYYVLVEEKLIKFKPSKSRLTNLFGGQTQEKNIFKKLKNRDLKNEENLISLFEYYNKL